MKKQLVLLLVSSITAGMVVAQSLAQSAKPVTINFYSSGDVNVKNLWEASLFPLYQKQNPNVQFNLIFSQAGAGNQAMIDRMAAAKKSGQESGIDILEGAVSEAADAGLLTAVDAKKVWRMNRVEANVAARLKGFGVPYRGSSVVLAYDSSKVAKPPTSLEDLLAWIQKNPGQFTYNTPDTGGSGNAFVTRVLKLGIDDKSANTFETDYDAALVGQWDKGFETLKTISKSLYNGGQNSKNNAETLQLLAKGAITMGPVWSDQGLSALKNGSLPANIKLVQIKPPFSGGSSYLGVAADSPNKAEAFKFLNWLLSDEPQSIVTDKMNGYPGIKIAFMPDDVRKKFGAFAKSFSFGFSSKFGADMNRLWYEKVAGTPQPQR
jgi:putative spermidine/putrescine transport system substrate-binding protein